MYVFISDKINQYLFLAVITEVTNTRLTFGKKNKKQKDAVKFRENKIKVDKTNWRVFSYTLLNIPGTNNQKNYSFKVGFIFDRSEPKLNSLQFLL